jgi:glycosyltransferase involved in cell wall biosynthesis
MCVGGAEMDILRNYSAINADPKFEIIVCIFGWPGALYQKIVDAGVQVRVIRSTPPSSTANKLAKIKVLLDNILFIRDIVASEQPDIVHCFLPRAYLLGGVAKIIGRRAASKPVWIMSRLSLNFYMKKHRLIGWIEKNIFHKFLGFKVYIGNSKAITNELVAERCSVDKVKLLYNGINTQEFATKRSQARGASRLRIAAVGNLHPYKGYDDLLDALSILNNLAGNLPDWVCEIAGEDVNGNQKRLLEKAKKLGVAEKVHFLGRLDNVAAFLAGCDVFVHPSHTEGLPNAIIEAMSSALPIVATNVGGIPELIDNEKNGLCVKSHNPAQLAHAIRTYIENPLRAYKIAQQALLKARKQFDLKISVAGCKGIYREVLGI